MRLILIRHFPTRNNLNEKFIGLLDIPCDAQYIANNYDHFEELRGAMSSPKVILSSPLLRARQTTEFLFPGRDYVVDERLRERDLGEWSNRPKSELRARYPEAFYPNGHLNFLYTPISGETFRSLAQRVVACLEDLCLSYSEEDCIVAVTHNGVITTVKCMVAGDFTNTNSFSFQPYLQPYEVEFSQLDFALIHGYIREL